MNIQKLQSKLQKKAFAFSGSYLNRSDENPEAFGDNVVRSLISEVGADIGGTAGLIGGGALGESLLEYNDSPKEALLKVLLPTLIGGGLGYAGGGYAAHKLTKNKSNARRTRREEKEDEKNTKKASVKEESQSKLQKKAFIAGLASYLDRADKNPDAVADNFIRSLFTELGAQVGGGIGSAGGLALGSLGGEALERLGLSGKLLKGNTGGAKGLALKLALPLVLGGGLGYAGGGYATHELTKNASADKYSSKGKKSIPFPTPKNFEATGDAVKDTDALLTYLRSLRNPKAGHAGSTTKGLLSDTAWLAGQKQRDAIRALTKNEGFLNSLKFLGKDTLNAMGMEGLTGSKYTAMKAPAFKDLLNENVLKVMQNNRKGPNPQFTAMLKNPEAFGLSAADAKGLRELLDLEGNTVGLGEQRMKNLNQLRSNIGKLNAGYAQKHKNLLNASKARGMRNLKVGGGVLGGGLTLAGLLAALNA